MPFLDPLEVGNLREFHADSWELKKMCFLVNHLHFFIFIKYFYFVFEVPGYFGCKEGSFGCVRRGPCGPGATASEL